MGTLKNQNQKKKGNSLNQMSIGVFFIFIVLGVMSQDLNCDESTQVHVLLKLFNIEGGSLTNVPIILERISDDQILMEETSDENGEIHACVESTSIDGSMRLLKSSTMNTNGMSITISHFQFGYFVTTAFCDSFPCILEEFESCEDKILVSLEVHNGQGGGMWHEEISWILYENSERYLSGFAPYEDILCFEENSTYTFEMHDSWVCSRN